MSDLEVRQLRYFVAVAEELHFGRAAGRLGMAQPPLSRAIRELERQLGVQLFERTTRHVVLTPAGAVLLRDARTALDAVAAAAQRARHIGQPAPGLRLALKADFDAGLLPQILEAYHREKAAIPVELMMGGRGEQVPALHQGRADVALLATPFDDRDLDIEPLLTEPRLVALAASDPLAARATLRLADLTGRMLPDGTPADREGLIPNDSEIHNGSQGPIPDARRTSLDLAQIFNLIELGSVILFPPASVARRHPRPAIAYRTVTDLQPTTLAVVWPQNCHSPAVAAFVRAATSVAAATYPPESATTEEPFARNTRRLRDTEGLQGIVTSS
ncbi:LysR family transcriptional regulator [Nocardia sp. CA-107356]|uniref:LysR family transcriptional regulator n=1 Tax=Nocardia sp. CA-107356 TaxID=3239972 RepID=UPI003D902E8F